MELCGFSSSEFWKYLECMISDPNFGFGGQRLQDN